MDLSVVICVKNEEKNIFPLYQAIKTSMAKYSCEIIFVNDGSTDQTRKEILKIDDPVIVLIELQKNYGQSSALSAGIEYATGTLICTMDGDLQNDPADVPKMIDLLIENDVDVVAGIRANRQDGIFLRKIPSKIANFIIRKTTGVNLKDYGCTLRVFRNKIAKDLGLYGELHRFIPVLLVLKGARIIQLDVQHHPRIHGNSKYGINRTLKVVADLILMVFFKKYLSKPMHLFGILGLVVFGVGIIINLYLLVEKLMGIDLWGKPMLLLGIMLTLGGIQLITTGIIAEVLMRTYYESQNKKSYQVRDIIKNRHSFLNPENNVFINMPSEKIVN